MIRGMILQAGEIRIGELLLLVTRKQSYEFTGKMVWNTGSYYRFIKKKKNTAGALNTQLTFPPVGVFCFWLDTYTGLYWLVVSTPLISQIGSSSQLSGKMKNVPNHQPVYSHG